MSAPSSALRVSESDFGDGLDEDIRTQTFYLKDGGPQPPVNPLVRLMKDTAQPLKVVTVVDAETGKRETVVVPDLPMAYDLLRRVRYANPRAKARVALAHKRGIARRLRRYRGAA